MDQTIKYYTPEIEEFHVGFEFEVFMFGMQVGKYGNLLPENLRDDEVKWRKNTVRNASDILHVSIALDKKKVRIKYLDKEDIESLDWVFDKETESTSNGKLYYKGNHMLFHSDDGLTIAIRDPSLDKNMLINLRSNEVFMINIKNKSELKVLLKQLRL